MKKLLPFILFLLCFSLPGKAQSIEELMNDNKVSVESVEEVQNSEEEGQRTQEPKGFISKYFEEFDNLKLLVTITLPSVLFFAAARSLESLAKGYLEEYELQAQKLTTTYSTATNELNSIEEKIFRLQTEREKLYQAIEKGGIVKEQPLNTLLEERKRVLEQLKKVNEALSRFLRRQS